MEDKIRVGITQGDINGIGLEVILKTFQDPLMCDLCTPVLFSSQKTINYYRKALGMEDIQFQISRDLNQLHPKKLNVFPCYEEEVQFDLGKSTPNGGKYALISIEKASEALSNKQIDVLVTAPINKHNIQSEQFKFPGHTEYFANRFGFEKGAMMLMCSDDLRVGLVTGHISLIKVAQLITVDRVVEKILQLKKTLITDFNIEKPKIAVLSINPHAGDNGIIGQEDDQVVKPAIDKVKNDTLVFGPYAADGFFGSGTYRQFDGIIAMYHDQGLIPFKTLSFNNGVNFSAGLPIIRTSPDHGTGYDIAGKNCADESSFRKAVYMAIDIFRRRKLHQEVSANPLKFSKIKEERE